MDEKDVTFDKRLLVVAGLPRTASTALYVNLSNHPSFAVPARKELDFFLKPGRTPAQYRKYFPDEIGNRIAVDISPYYGLDLAVPERIARMAPKAAVILVLREPEAWLQSFHTQVQSHLLFDLPFQTFATGDWFGRRANMPDFRFSGDLYRGIVRAYAAVFGDRLLVMDYALLQSDLGSGLARIEAFAGAERWFTQERMDGRRHNSSAIAQRHPRVFRWLIANRLVAATMAKLLPPTAVAAGRRLLFLSGQMDKPGPAGTPGPRPDPLAAEVTRESALFYRELFRESPMHLGDSLREV